MLLLLLVGRLELIVCVEIVLAVDLVARDLLLLLLLVEVDLSLLLMVRLLAGVRARLLARRSLTGVRCRRIVSRRRLLLLGANLLPGRGGGAIR